MSRGALLTVGLLIQPFRCLLVLLWMMEPTLSPRLWHLQPLHFSICTSFLGTAIHSFYTKALYNESERGFYYLFRWKWFFKSTRRLLAFWSSQLLSLLFFTISSSISWLMYMLCGKYACVLPQQCSEQNIELLAFQLG